MDPFFARNRLSAYIDGALSEREAAELADAIASDEALREEYEAMRQAVGLLRREGPTRAPTGFHARVLGAVEGEPMPAGTVVRLRQLWNRIPLEAVALAAAAAVVVLVIQGRPDPEAADDAPTEALADKDAGVPPPPPLRQDPSPPAEGGSAAPAAPAARPAASLEAERASVPAAAPAAAPTPVSPKSQQKSAGLEPYVASWEKGGAGSSDGGLATTYGYRLRISSPEVLFNLSSIAENAGGEVRDGAGRLLKPRLLTQDDDYEQTLLAVPLAEADSVRGHLEALGSTSVPPPAAPSLFQADYAVFILEVRLEG